MQASKRNAERVIDGLKNGFGEPGASAPVRRHTHKHSATRTGATQREGAGAGAGVGGRGVESPPPPPDFPPPDGLDEFGHYPASQGSKASRSGSAGTAAEVRRGGVLQGCYREAVTEPPGARSEPHRPPRVRPARMACLLAGRRPFARPPPSVWCLLRRVPAAWCLVPGA